MRTSTRLINDEGRECSRCGVFKIWDMFYKNICKNRGYSSTCIPCYSQINSKGTFERQATENRMEGQTYRKPDRIVDKMTTAHKYVEDKPYWDTSDMIEIGTKPISALYNHIK